MNHGQIRRVSLVLLTVLASGAVAIVSSYDAVWSQSVEQCKAISLQCPVAGGCTYTSPYDLTRIDPVEKKGIRPHRGVDIRAIDGTEVRAAESGRVIYAGDAGSAGVAVEIDHQGARYTRYFHLQKGSLVVAPNATVTKGQIIGRSDTTGRTNEPHLHFEYALNGANFNTRGRIDPGPCIGTGVNGSISVRDNGNLADDSFEVAVDGLVLGSTSIGQQNSFAINGLRPGQHRLTIRVLVAPDNQGTIEITLSNGWRFANGSTLVSEVLTAGQIKDYVFTVPS